MSAAAVLAVVAEEAQGSASLMGMMLRERADVSGLLGALAVVDGPEAIEATEALLDLQLALERSGELNRVIKEGLDRLRLLAESAATDAPTASERRAAAELARREKAERAAAIAARAPRLKALRDRGASLPCGILRCLFAARAVVARRRAGLSITAAARAIGCTPGTLRRIEELGPVRSGYGWRWRGPMSIAYDCTIESLSPAPSDDDLLDVDLDVLEGIIAAREARP